MLVVMFSIASLIVRYDVVHIAASGQSLAINEILSDPVGTDTGNEWIELYNPTCESISLEGYSITASSGDYYVFGSVAILPDSFVTVHWRAEGVDTSSDLYTGSTVVDSNMGNTSGYVALFSGAVRSNESIIDYVAYGASGQSWVSNAVSAGIWVVDKFTKVGASGQSLGLMVDGEDSNAPEDWELVDVPSMGFYNNESKVNVCVSPTPTSSPTPTFTPVPTFTPTPTSTPVPTQTPTPTLTPTPTVTYKPVNVIFKVASPVVMDEGSMFTVSVENAEREMVYGIKIEASFDGETWYKALTKGVENNYFPWNSAWENFPTVHTDSLGNATLQGTFKIKVDEQAGNYTVRAKIKLATSSATVLSSHETVVVAKPSPRVPSPSLTPTPREFAPEASDGDQDPRHTVSYKLNAISELLTRALGNVVSVTGRVSVPLGTLGSTILYVQDETDGVLVTLPAQSTFVCGVGQAVSLTGEFSLRYGEDRIKVNSLEDMTCLLERSDIVPRDVEVEGVGKKNEGQIVSVYGVVSDTSGDKFTLDAGEHEFTVVIKETTGIQKPKMQVGYYVWITGVVGQYNQTYRVLPRYQEDVQVSELPFSRVLGSIILPKTAVFPADVSLWVLLLGFGTLCYSCAVILEEKRSHETICRYKKLL